MDSKSTGASSKGQGKASANSPSPSFKVSANADGVPRGGKVNAKAAVSADSAPPQLLAEVPNFDGADAKESSEGDGHFSDTGDVFGDGDDDQPEQTTEELASEVILLLEQHFPRSSQEIREADTHRLRLFCDDPPKLHGKQLQTAPPTTGSLADKFAPLKLPKYKQGSVVEFFKKAKVPMNDSLNPVHWTTLLNYFAEAFGGHREVKYALNLTVHGEAHERGVRPFMGSSKNKQAGNALTFQPVLQSTGTGNAAPGSKDTDYTGLHVGYSVDFPHDVFGHTRTSQPIVTELHKPLWALGCNSAAKLLHDEARLTPEFLLLAMVRSDKQLFIREVLVDYLQCLSSRFPFAALLRQKLAAIDPHITDFNVAPTGPIIYLAQVTRLPGDVGAKALTVFKDTFVQQKCSVDAGLQHIVALYSFNYDSKATVHDNLSTLKALCATAEEHTASIPLLPGTPTPPSRVMHPACQPVCGIQTLLAAMSKQKWNVEDEQCLKDLRDKFEKGDFFTWASLINHIHPKIELGHFAPKPSVLDGDSPIDARALAVTVRAGKSSTPTTGSGAKKSVVTSTHSHVPKPSKEPPPQLSHKELKEAYVTAQASTHQILSRYTTKSDTTLAEYFFENINPPNGFPKVRRWSLNSNGTPLYFDYQSVKKEDLDVIKPMVYKLQQARVPNNPYFIEAIHTAALYQPQQYSQSKKVLLASPGVSLASAEGIAEAAADKAAEKVLAKHKAESAVSTSPPVQFVSAPMFAPPMPPPVQYIPPHNFVYPMQGNAMAASGMHGVDMYSGNLMQGGNMMPLPMQMFNSYTRDQHSRQQLQISDGSEPQADGGGGGGYGMAARLPHQQSGSFPHGNGS